MTEPARPPLDRATVDRWQVAGGVAGVASVAITVIGTITKHVPFAVPIGIAVAAVGSVLLYRWGRRGPHTAARFLGPLAAVVAGTVLAAVTATRAPAPPPPVAAATTSSSASRTTTAPSATSPSPAPTSDAPPVDAEPEQRTKGTLKLTDNFGVDLDSKQGNWDIEGHESHRSVLKPVDLALHFGDLTVAEAIAPLESEPVGHRQCADATGRFKKIANEDIAVRDVFCVKTGEGRYARMVVVGKGGDYPQGWVQMDVTVWETVNG